MKKYISILKNTTLFSGASEEETELMLSCLRARLCTYEKGEFVLHEGEYIERLMILVEGEMHIQRDDHWGNRSIISTVGVGEMFGEAYCAPESGPLLNDVLAVEDSAVIFLDIAKLLTVCPNGCSFHELAVKNLFFAISEKNRRLVRKLDFMSRRTTREKLIAYLSEESKRQNSSAFSIPFNRRQLADFLAVDRSAMSNELCKMRDEGLIEFEKNRFKLL
ncbi:MAG: Crp/Fnr family transcriptional regulator [Oscillospiraceae bacterium]